MGGEFFVSLNQVAGKAVIKLAAQKYGWFGHFLVGGGPFERFALCFHLMLGFGMIGVVDGMLMVGFHLGKS